MNARMRMCVNFVGCVFDWRTGYHRSAIGNPQGFGGSGENGYLSSGNWGALIIISRNLGSQPVVLGI